ncbi:MAG: hypothetical protein M3R20_00770 [Pseudomonadota bacterium]|nr:hypothetical protein [Pseudomonadota bacterium]
MKRKLELLERFGGKCNRCGYDRNQAALTWHHLDPGKKAFELDLRSISNRSPAAILEESKKCVLLCANCHAEAHFPHFGKESLARGRKRVKSPHADNTLSASPV